MRKYALTVAVVLSALVALPAAAQARTLKWSGYTWTVRSGTGGPGVNNIWSAQNASVRHANLILRIVERRNVWTSTELTSNRIFGFGRYRWVVNSDLSQASPAAVLGLFTYSPKMTPSFGEQDFEFTRAWSAHLWPGWFVSWNASNHRAFGNFDVPSAPPYTATITWLRGSISFRLTDWQGQVIFRRTVKTKAVPRGIRAHINYWVTDHNGITAPDATPQISIRSFKYTPAK